MAKIGTRLLSIDVGGTTFDTDVSNVRLVAGETESDFVSFADAAAGGGRQYTLAMTMAQDAATASLWDMLWSAAGDTVACILKPYGNATASPTQPHYEFDAVVKEPDGDLLGGEADASTTAVFTTDVEWPLLAKPTKVTA